MQINTKRYITEAFILATVITGLLVLATVFITKTPLNPIELASVYFSFACTWLCTRQVRFSYVLAVISTTLLAVTFWQAELFGSMALNLYLIPTVIYGYFIWGKDSNPKLVENVKPRSAVFYILFTAITWAGAYFVITTLGGQMVALDGWLLVGTVLAQYLLDRKKLQNWMVWILVDVVSVYVYFQAGLYLLAAQFVLFGANAVYGHIQWKKTMATGTVTAPEKLALTA
jgi:nicotinamide mononucleotide transporter